MSDERGPTANDKRIGMLVRQARLEQSVSQERLAEMLGVTFQQVQKYEGGKNRIAASRLFAIARALERPIEWFYATCTPQGDAEATPIAAPATPEAHELQRIFAAIRSPLVRKRVVSLTRALAEDAST